VANPTPDRLESPPAAPVGRYRWVVCGLLFLATTINYIDRQVISLLKPTLSAEYNWTETDYSYIIFNFTLAYAIGLVVVGRVIDKLGTKLGYALAIIFWSIAAMAHALAPSYGGPLIPSLALDSKTGFTFVTLAGAVAGFSLARFGLGLGEAGNFPASIKAVAEWFPKRERALATGVFNSGTNVGALVAPLVVPWVTINWGWRWAFLITGALGFLWLALWWWRSDATFHSTRTGSHQILKPVPVGFALACLGGSRLARAGDHLELRAVELAQLGRCRVGRTLRFVRPFHRSRDLGRVRGSPRARDDRWDTWQSAEV